MEYQELERELDQLQELERKLEPEVTKETGYKNIIIIDCIPQVDAQKFDKLKKVLEKICTSVGPVTENGLYIPTDKQGTTLGFAFCEFVKAEKATLAVEKLNGYKLDKNHVFSVNHYEDFEKYGSITEEFTPPPVTAPQEMENLRWWLLDPRAMEQYVVRWGNETQVYWNEPTLNPGTKPTPLISKTYWTDSLIFWSPEGSYLATLHSQGIILWGGPNWSKIMRFFHPGVKLLQFSPKENYLVTLSSSFAETDNTKDPQSIIIWDVLSGKKLRGFPSGQTNQWPIFQWSFDDKYFAKLGTDLLSVYETPSMSLLDKKSFQFPGIKEFSWTPGNEHLIACWIPESKDSVAKIILVEIPSRRNRIQRNLINVTDCQLNWQSRGEYLCVRVDRSKAKKNISSSFEIFRVKEKNVPVEVLETKAPIQAFAMEPNGNRLAVIQGESPRFEVVFHELTKKKLVHLGTLPKQANHLFWSPQGHHIVLAGLKQSAQHQQLEFFNVDDMESMGTGDHYLVSDVEWDPSGRYVASYVSQWRNLNENGYQIWSFSGKLLCTVPKEKFFQLHWRPRPASLLSEEKEKEILTNLKAISKKYSAMDSKESELAREGIAKQKKELRDQWVQYLEESRRQWNALRTQRESLRGGYPSDPDSDYEIVQEDVEEVLEETSTFI